MCFVFISKKNLKPLLEKLWKTKEKKKGIKKKSEKKPSMSAYRPNQSGQGPSHARTLPFPLFR